MSATAADTPVSICSSFILGAPPGELNEVLKDIKSLTSDDKDVADEALINQLKPALQKHNEEQLVVVKLPQQGLRQGQGQGQGQGQEVVLISAYNRLSDGRYYDTRCNRCFEFDHLTSTASRVESYQDQDSSHGSSSLVHALNTAFSRHFAEHYPPSSTDAAGVTLSGFLVTTAAASTTSSQSSDSIAILLSTTKSSPSNFLSARWRSVFFYSPGSQALQGSIKINIHYYEDGNVALTTTKEIAETEVELDDSQAQGSEADAVVADAVVTKIAAIEKQHQEQVNRTFVSMNEQGFKALRRQLPVTRQKVEWEKIRGYSLSDTLKGAREI